MKKFAILAALLSVILVPVPALADNQDEINERIKSLEKLAAESVFKLTNKCSNRLLMNISLSGNVTVTTRTKCKGDETADDVLKFNFADLDNTFLWYDPDAKKVFVMADCINRTECVVSSQLNYSKATIQILYKTEYSREFFRQFYQLAKLFNPKIKIQ